MLYEVITTFIPDLVAQLYPDEINPAALDAGKQRALFMLQNAASMELNVSGTSATVTVINNTGHKLPSGYPEGRRIWINLQAYDSAGSLIYESGAYDSNTAILDRITSYNVCYTKLLRSIFSMDGDLANLPKLVNLKKKYEAFLYVDEAHALGVVGSQGLGLAEQVNLIEDVDFIVGTFGKALASVGAFVVCDAIFKSYNFV